MALAKKVVAKKATKKEAEKFPKEIEIKSKSSVSNVEIKTPSGVKVKLVLDGAGVIDSAIVTGKGKKYSFTDNLEQMLCACVHFTDEEFDEAVLLCRLLRKEIKK